MENKNFLNLTNQYRRKGRALKGYDFLKTTIDKKQDERLASVLRNHLLKDIDTEEEVEIRDNVDFLLEYYGIVEVGITSGVVPSKFPKWFVEEIKYILGNQSVIRYLEYYPLFLPKLLFNQLFGSVPFPILNDQDINLRILLFNKFLSLNQRKWDVDVELFLYILDDGETEDELKILDLWEMLENKESIQTKLKNYPKKSLNQLLWGFIKYIDLLERYYDLLEQSRDFKILRSAFWYHHSYWFNQINSKLGDIIEIAIPRLISTVNSITNNDLAKTYSSFSPSSTENFKLTKNSAGDLRKSNVKNLKLIQEKIKFLLDNSLGLPLRVFAGVEKSNETEKTTLKSRQP